MSSCTACGTDYEPDDLLDSRPGECWPCQCASQQRANVEAIERARGR